MAAQKPVVGLCRFHLQVPTTDVAISLVLDCAAGRNAIDQSSLTSSIKYNLTSAQLKIYSDFPNDSQGDAASSTCSAPKPPKVHTGLPDMQTPTRQV